MAFTPAQAVVSFFKKIMQQLPASKKKDKKQSENKAQQKQAAQPSVQVPPQPPVKPAAQAPQQPPVKPRAQAPQQPPVQSRAQAPQQPPVPPRAQAPQQPPVQPRAQAPQQPPVQPRAQAPQQPPVQPRAQASQQPPVQPRAQAPQQPPVQPRAQAPQQPPVQLRAQAPQQPPVQPRAQAPQQSPVQPAAQAPQQSPVQPAAQAQQSPIKPAVQAPQQYQYPQYQGQQQQYQYPQYQGQQQQYQYHQYQGQQQQYQYHQYQGQQQQYPYPQYQGQQQQYQYPQYLGQQQQYQYPQYPGPFQAPPPYQPQVNLQNNLSPIALSFKDWIRMLDSRKATILSQALFSENKTFNMNSLLHIMQPLTTMETMQIKTILNTHTVQYLGGGNSKNFLVTNTITGAKEVLKLEYRMGNPDTHVQKLNRDPNLQEYLVKVATSQMVDIQGDPYRISRRYLQVTDYCQGNDLSTCASIPQSTQQKLSTAQNIYTQMAEVLIRLEQSGTFHSDMKNSNWLLDENGHLKIADTKALCPTDHASLISWNTLRSKGYNSLMTPYVTPPELYRDHQTQFSPSKATAFMFAKNLYEFLASNSPQKPMWSYMQGKHNAEHYDFSAPIFQTFEGSRFALLIRACIKEDPAQRLTMQEIQHAIKAIDSLKKNPELIKACNNAFLNLDNNTTGLSPNLPGRMNQWNALIQDPLCDEQKLKVITSEIQEYTQVITNMQNLQRIDAYINDSRISQKLQDTYNLLKTPSLNLQQLQSINKELGQFKKMVMQSQPKNNPDKEHYNNLVSKLKTDLGHIQMVRGVLIQVENKTGIYARMDLKEINSQLEKLMTIAIRANPKPYDNNKKTDAQPAHPGDKMKKELQDMKGPEQEANLEVNTNRKFNA